MRPYTKQDILSIYEQLKTIAKKAAKDHNILKSIKYIEASAYWAYNFNWMYYDEELENLLKHISQEITECVDIINLNSNRAVFLDSFCLDNRGLTQQYLRAMMRNGMSILYICTANSIKENSDILKELKEYSGSSLVLFNDKRYNPIEKTIVIKKTIEKYNPSHVFLHLTPWETSALMACHSINGPSIYNINLTDHAFWMGASFINFNVEFRLYGTSVSLEKRGLKKSQILFLPYYPITPISLDFKGFPELPSNSIIVFTGGGLYKMLGMNDIFFRMMERILSVSENVYILVAGFNYSNVFENKCSKIKGGNRIRQIGIRKDIDEVFAHCDIFLGTYPTSGSLMVQYAAKHGKPIVSYRNINDEENALEEILNCNSDDFKTYTSLEEMTEYASKLIKDADYRLNEGKRMASFIITPDQFEKNFCKMKDLHEPIKNKGNYSIDYDSFFKRYLELENAQFLATKSMVRLMKLETIWSLSSYRCNFCEQLFKLFVARIRRLMSCRFFSV